MTSDLARETRPRHAPPAAPRRAERRRLEQRDRDSARLAELHRLRSLLAGAAAVVAAGWLQHGWFQCRDDDGRLRTVTERDLHLVAGHPVTGACLVGAVVHAAGGPPAAGSQAVRRTLDLLWRALHQVGTEPGGWCPPPAVRSARVLDLARWNDHPARTAGDVHALLLAARHRADAEVAQLQQRASVGA